jgi:hypothetical protein
MIRDILERASEVSFNIAKENAKQGLERRNKAKEMARALTIDPRELGYSRIFREGDIIPGKVIHLVQGDLTEMILSAKIVICPVTVVAWEWIPYPEPEHSIIADLDSYPPSQLLVQLDIVGWTGLPASDILAGRHGQFWKKLNVDRLM